MATRPRWDEAALTDQQPVPKVKTAADNVPAGPALHLADAFARAVGLAGVTDALEDVREIHAARYLSWPFSRAAGWFAGRDPVRLGRVSGDARTAVAAGAEAQQPEIDSAITVFADAVGEGLPDPWPRTVRAAARSRAGEVSGALSAAISESSRPARGYPPGGVSSALGSGSWSRWWSRASAGWGSSSWPVSCTQRDSTRRS